MKKTPVTIQILPAASRGKVEGIWKEIEASVANPPLVCTWDVVSTWLDQFEDLVSYWFIIGYSEKKPIGITLVTKETTRWIPFPVDAYHLGTQGEPLKDWVHMINNNILVENSYREAFISSLGKTLVESFSWEAFLVRDADPLLTESLSKAIPNSITLRKVPETCHYIDLELLRKEKRSAMDAFSRDTRYQIRRSMKEFGNLTIEDAKTMKQALDIFTELQILHQNSLRKKGRRGSYSSERFTAFHEELIRKRFKKGSLMFFRVISDRLGTLGCFYLLIDNGVAFGYSSGMNDFSNRELTSINRKRLKPGFVMHALCLQVCLDRGLKEYNFSTGSGDYKKELAPHTKTLTTLKLQRSLKSKLREAMVESYLKAEEKQQFRIVLKPFYKAYRLLNS